MDQRKAPVNCRLRMVRRLAIARRLPSVKLASGGTGMVLGWGGGTGEIRNWIAAAAVADGKPATIVDYVPIHASPIGAGFALWERV